MDVIDRDSGVRKVVLGEWRSSGADLLIMIIISLHMFD